MISDNGIRLRLTVSLIVSLVLATFAFESNNALADDWPKRGQNVYRRSWIDGAIGPHISRTGKPTVLWSLDFKDRFKITPKDVHLGNRASRCSIVGCDGLIFVNTTHSVSRDGKRADPDLPSFVCLDEKTGETVWMDKSPGSNIVRNQHCNPVILQVGDRRLVAIGQGDGWVRAFEAVLALAFGNTTSIQKPKAIATRSHLASLEN